MHLFLTNTPQHSNPHFRKIWSSVIAMLFMVNVLPLSAQHANLTPIVSLDLYTAPVEVPSKFQSTFPAGRTLQIPTQYTVSVFHAGSLSKPRFMAFGPNGVLYVSDMNAGRVWALPDLDNDGVADERIEAASGFSGNHDVTFYKGDMYVTEPTRIWKCTDSNGDGIFETKSVFIQNLGNNEQGGHSTRTLVFDAINEKAYVSIGSSCNVCWENHRAIIEQYNDDGTGRRVFATGIRNAVGLALHPETNQLWANNNGSDQQGNEIPPEWIDIIRDNGFYGHPFAYGGGVWFDFNANSAYRQLLPITAQDSANVARLVQPAALVRAHSAPMALAFLNDAFDSEIQHGFLSALRGSWNTTNPRDYRGYKVIYGHLSSARDTTVDYISDFCSGFLTDNVNRTYWGRPVGIAVAEDGKVYISSDEGNRFVLVLTPKNLTQTPQIKGISSQVGHSYPVPAKNTVNIPFNLKQETKVQVILFNITGEKMMTLVNKPILMGRQNLEVDLSGIPSGSYVLQIVSENFQVSQKLILAK